MTKAFLSLNQASDKGSDGASGPPSIISLGNCFLEGPATIIVNGQLQSYPNGTYVRVNPSVGIDVSDNLEDIKHNIHVALIAFLQAHYGVSVNHIDIVFVGGEW